jgi:hypothetical protein
MSVTSSIGYFCWGGIAHTPTLGAEADSSPQRRSGIALWLGNRASVRFGVLPAARDNGRQRNRLTIRSSDHGPAASAEIGVRSMMQINQLRSLATHTRVAQLYR